MLNPTRKRLQEIYGLDLEITSGSGSYFVANGQEYLDCLSQYGSLPFGHNPPELWDNIREYEKTGKPVMMQPLRTLEAEKLADDLRDRTGYKYCTLANSGAEAVEASIKLARAITGKDKIISTSQSFHGKTLGALSATGNSYYQKDFGLPVENFKYVPYNDLIELEAELEDAAAFIVEPVQGEGGIVVPDDDYVEKAVNLCASYGVLSIVDEVQTGLGRTGPLLSSEGHSDILLLGKALGGGMVPVSAVLSNVWDERFGKLHSSTFANNNLVASVARESLSMLPLPLEDLRGALVDLQQRYPTVIKDIRGKGYMCGVEFHEILEGSALMSFSTLNGGLTVLIGSYLLNKHRVLTAPTFNNSQVLRVQPPLVAGKKEITTLVDALSDLCEVIQSKNYYKLVEHLIGNRTEEVFPEQNTKRSSGEKVRGNYCFLIHYTEEADISRSDPSITNTREFADWVKYSGPGFAYPINTVTSNTGDTANGMLMSLPLLTEDMMGDNRRDATRMIDSAIGMSEGYGATRFGLGAFTSIITLGGSTIRDSRVPLTSGSTLTAVSGVELLKEHAPENSVVAVVGATGSIGNLATKLIERWATVIPVGRGDNLGEALSKANAVFVATNSSAAIINPKELNDGTIVVDVATPKNVLRTKHAQSVRVFDGGLVSLPNPIDLGPFQTLPKGLSWGCLGETILLALEGSDIDYSIGKNISVEDADYIRELAIKHGFRFRGIEHGTT